MLCANKREVLTDNCDKFHYTVLFQKELIHMNINVLNSNHSTFRAVLVSVKAMSSLHFFSDAYLNIA